MPPRLFPSTARWQQNLLAARDLPAGSRASSSAMAIGGFMTAGGMAAGVFSAAGMMRCF